MSALARALFFAALPMAWAEYPAVTVQIHMDATGSATVRATSRTGQQFDPLLKTVIHCRGRMASKSDLFDEFRCANALQYNDISLEALIDLRPIARRLPPADEIEVWLDYPRFGFESSSVPLEDHVNLSGITRTGRFTAGKPPEPFRIQFGYRPEQLSPIYLPLAALALALVLIAMALSKFGYADLNRSLFLLGAIFWLGTATYLQAAGPARILLSGTPLGNVAAPIIEYWVPLLCVAAGASWGSRNQPERTRKEVFAEVLWGYGMLLFPLSFALGAIPVIVEDDWLVAAPLLALATVSLFVCRWRIRANAGLTVRQLSAGELKERVSAMAARIGRRDVGIYVSSSSRSQVLNAFALLRKGILMTAPLIQSLSRREVDAVAAHELSHLGHVRSNPWAALLISVALFQTPLPDLILPGSGGRFLALLLPVIVFFMTLHGARRREFAADAGSVALTGDARAMISALAKIARGNGKQLDLNPVAEWFATHPSTRKRIRALAASAKLGAAEIEALSVNDDPGPRYVLPPDEGGGRIFTLAWQNANVTRYTWTVLLSASGTGLMLAGLLDRYAGNGLPQLLCGIAAGCAITKIVASAVMSAGYADLRRKLTAKLGARGQLVGLAMDNEPRVYNGFRFSDVGLLSFEEGRLCYRSERTTILLNGADVVEVSRVPAAPASWRRLQPMVRFRSAELLETKAFILHPLDWGATPARLFRSIAKWKAAALPAETTSIRGFDPVSGQPFQVPAVSQVVRAFRVPGAITLVGVSLTGWFLRSGSWPAWYALVITAGAHLFMFLPSMLYRPSALPPPLPPPLGAGEP